ncbi:MAG: hypothetical protein ACRDCE_19380, partial [Cetobacterium sp.]|uniref:hypothetical protein n=1 Tax=Cetobacterium sp. TaxID=2071632 RepID=UPI003EE5F696
EQAVFKLYRDQDDSYKQDYTQTLGQVRRARANLKGNAEVEVPFCEALSVLKIEDYSAKNKGIKKSFSEIYFEVTGKTPEESCTGNKAAKKTVVSANKAEVQSDKATVDTLRALTAAVRDCGRAKHEVLGKTTDLKSLTQAQAEDIIAQCELYKLEAELQG